MSQKCNKNLFNLAHNIPQIVGHSHSLVYRGADEVSFIKLNLNLGNTVRVPEDNTNLGRGKALLSQLEDLILDLIAGDLQPLRNRPVWKEACKASTRESMSLLPTSCKEVQTG